MSPVADASSAAIAVPPFNTDIPTVSPPDPSVVNPTIKLSVDIYYTATADKLTITRRPLSGVEVLLTLFRKANRPTM